MAAENWMRLTHESVGLAGFASIFGHSLTKMPSQDPAVRLVDLFENTANAMNFL